MVGTSNAENTSTPPSNSGGEFNSSNSNQWGWQPRRGIRGFCPGPRRGMYGRGGYMFPGPRGYVMPPQQQFYNQV